MSRLFLEGLPGAGKSTALNIIAEHNVPVVQELGLTLGPDGFPGNGQTIEEILEIDDWFIGQEERRTQVSEGVYDRSYFTHLTYAYGYGRYTELQSLEPTVEKYRRAVALGRLAIPTAIAYIDVEPELSIERQEKRIRSGVPPLDSFWMDKSFLSDLRDAYECLFQSCESIPVLRQDGANKSAIVANNISNFYNKLAEKPAQTDPRLDFDQYILGLRSTGHDS